MHVEELLRRILLEQEETNRLLRIMVADKVPLPPDWVHDAIEAGQRVAAMDLKRTFEEG